MLCFYINIQKSVNQVFLKRKNQQISHNSVFGELIQSVRPSPNLADCQSGKICSPQFVKISSAVHKCQ